MRIIALCPKITKNLGPIWKTYPFKKALCGDDPEHNAGTIHASNLEYLPVLKATRGHDPEQKAGTIHASNQDHLLIFKALCGNDPKQNAG